MTAWVRLGAVAMVALCYHLDPTAGWLAAIAAALVVVGHTEAAIDAAAILDGPSAATVAIECARICDAVADLEARYGDDDDLGMKVAQRCAAEIRTIASIRKYP